jgi:hypothetical protein
MFHRKDTHIEPEIEAQKVVMFEGAAQHQVEQQLYETNQKKVINWPVGRQGGIPQYVHLSASQHPQQARDGKKHVVSAIQDVAYALIESLRFFRTSLLRFSVFSMKKL